MGQSEQTGRIITQAPAATWERAIAAVAGDTDLDVALLRTAVVDAVDTDTPLYRLDGRDGRDDLDRGQHPPSPTAADIAALSVPRTATIRPPERRPGDDASRPPVRCCLLPLPRFPLILQLVALQTQRGGVGPLHPPQASRSKVPGPS